MRKQLDRWLGNRPLVNPIFQIPFLILTGCSLYVTYLGTNWHPGNQYTGIMLGAYVISMLLAGIFLGLTVFAAIIVGVPGLLLWAITANILNGPSLAFLDDYTQTFGVISLVALLEVGVLAFIIEPPTATARPGRGGSSQIPVRNTDNATTAPEPPSPPPRQPAWEKLRGKTIYSAGGKRIGEIDAHGYICDAGHNRVGYIDRNGYVYDAGQNRIGQIGADGTVYTAGHSRVGNVSEDGTAFTAGGDRTGEIRRPNV